MESDYNEPEFHCPLVDAKISDTICYDIQMVTGPGNLINKSILNDFAEIIDPRKVTDERAVAMCPRCPFNQLR